MSSSSSAGVHIVVESEPSGWIRVTEMLDGGQLSYTARVGDRIRRINDHDVQGMSEADVNFLLEGQEGTVVKFDFLRAKEPQDAEVNSQLYSVVWSPFTVTAHRCSNATQDIQIALMKEVTKLCQDELEPANDTSAEVELAIGTSAFTFGRLESRFFNLMRGSIRENSLKREAMVESSIHSSQQDSSHLDSSRLESSRSHQTVMALRHDLQTAVAENGRLSERLMEVRRAMQARDAVQTESLKLVISVDPALASTFDGDAKIRSVLQDGLASEIGFSLRRLEVVYLQARTDSVSTHDVLVNIHAPFNEKYDPGTDNVVDEPAAFEAAQDILERIGSGTLRLDSDQVRIVSGKRSAQHEHVALLRRTVEQFSSPAKTASMEGFSEFDAVEELTKTRIAMRQAIERAAMLDELNAGLVRQMRSKDLRMQEMEREKAKLEKGLQFRKLTSLQDQAAHEQELQEVRAEKDRRIKDLEVQLVKIDQRLKVQEIMAGDAESIIQKRAREAPRLSLVTGRNAETPNQSANASTMPAATPFSIREGASSVDPADLGADWIKDDENGARWVLDPSPESPEDNGGADAKRRNARRSSNTSRNANPGTPRSYTDSNFSLVNSPMSLARDPAMDKRRVSAMGIVPVHRASPAQRASAEGHASAAGQEGVAAESSDEDRDQHSPHSNHSIPISGLNSRSSSLHSLQPSFAIPVKKVSIAEPEAELTSAVDNLQENMNKLSTEELPF